MAGLGRLLVQWSPHEKDSFFVGAEAVKLYRIKSRGGDGPRAEGIPQGNEQQFSLVAVESDVSGAKEIIKCIATTPHEGENKYIAVGTSAGRMVLVDFSRTENKVVKEFVPRFPRVANCLAWNPFNRSQVACGLDKVRNDYCTLIWDITYSEGDSSGRGSAAKMGMSMGVPSDTRINIGQSWRPDSVNRACREYTNSESSCALQWKPDEPSILACGTGAKWLRVYDLRQNSTFSQSFAAHAKSVNGVAYNPHHTNLLATHSDDAIVKIWDTRNPDKCLYSFSAGNNPIAQFSWSPTRRSLLSTISNHENCIRLWDLHSMNTEQYENHMAASHEKGSNSGNTSGRQFSHMSKMNRVVYTSESLAAMEWHPTESLVILTVGANSGNVAVKRVSEYAPIAWAPTGSLQIASGKATKENLDAKRRSIVVYDDVVTARGGIRVSVGSGVDTIESSGDFSGIEDISAEMSVRAKMGYQFNILRNIEIANEREAVLNQQHGTTFMRQRGSGLSATAASSSPHGEQAPFLAGVWQWLQHVKDVVAAASGTDVPLRLTTCGVYPIISGPQQGLPDPTSPTSRQRSMSIDGEQKSVVQTVTGALPSFPVYTSPGRTLALRICGWGSDWTPLPKRLDEILTEIQQSEDYERAAAVALFHNKLNLAIDCLVNGAEAEKRKAMASPGGQNSSVAQHALTRSNELQMIALSLSGYNESGPSPLWQKSCKQFKDSYSNPYVKCAFSFLASAENDKEYKAILNDTDILFSDRVAFACRFLTDEKLVEFLETMHTAVVRSGRLGGLLLTGLNTRGVDLVEQYINNSGDVQTAAILMSFAVPSLFKDERVQRWMTEYRELLDRWQLWHERASLDVERLNTTKTKSESQTAARCNFCNQSLSDATHGRAKQSARMTRTGAAMAQIPKVTSCPHCRKPLPRCNLCSLTMGTGMSPQTDSALVATATENIRTTRPNIWKTDSSSFEHWMTWCQTCRHGGHAFHLLEWFKSHTTCPVAGCHCPCMSKDHIARQRYADVSPQQMPVPQAVEDAASTLMRDAREMRTVRYDNYVGIAGNGITKS